MSASVRPPGPVRTLVLGPAASGKSEVAEHLLGAEPRVTYLATGDVPEGPSGGRPGTRDDEWAARVARHRARRPTSWTTLETADVAAALAHRPEALLLDAVGTWLTGVLDRAGAWDGRQGWRESVAADVDAFVAAWTGRVHRAVAVSEEVGWGVVPGTASGRLFRDELGGLNRRLASASDEVLLVVAGRVLDLGAGPRRHPAG